MPLPRARSVGCGSQQPFECDKDTDCADGGVCCLKAPTTSKLCAGRIFASGGTYCRALACPASEILLCNGGPCVNGVCTKLQLRDAPGKILNGCL